LGIGTESDEDWDDRGVSGGEESTLNEGGLSLAKDTTVKGAGRAEVLVEVPARGAVPAEAGREESSMAGADG